MKENIISTISFPHSCVWCQRYYPKCDRNNVMRGGGECWSWSRIRGGDSVENQCCDFEPMDNRCLVQKAMYVVKAVMDEEGLYVVFEDSFLHSLLLKVDCDFLSDGISEMKSRMLFWRDYFCRCIEMMPCGTKSAVPAKSKKKKKQEETEMDAMQNPNSPVRKRFNTIVRGFPRHVQLAHKPSVDGEFSTKIRLYNSDEGASLIEIWDASSRRFVDVVEYCSLGDSQRMLVDLVRGEFAEYVRFVEFFASELDG